ELAEGVGEAAVLVVVVLDLGVERARGARVELDRGRHVDEGPREVVEGRGREAAHAALPPALSARGVELDRAGEEEDRGPGVLLVLALVAGAEEELRARLRRGVDRLVEELRRRAARRVGVG